MIILTIISSVHICIHLLLNQCDQSYSSLYRVIYVLTKVYFDLYIINISYDRIYLQVILINFKNGISFQNELKHSFVYLAIS